jgi:AcrR family transcriptional regulator
VRLVIAAKERCPDEAAAGPHRARRLRVDAERNRLALLDAARAVFAKQGIEAPLEEVARRAGVGIATLYRRFPTRGQLVAAAFVDQVAQYVTVAEQALRDGDPWSGFVRFVEWICAAQANDRGLGDLLSMALPADERIEELAALAKGHVVELVERAKAAGELRPDFVGEDLLVLLIANAGIVRVTGQDAPDASRRMVAMFLDAFHARRPASSFPAAPSSEQMHLAMLRLARDRGCAGATDNGSDRPRTQNPGRRPDASGTSGR